MDKTIRYIALILALTLTSCVREEAEVSVNTPVGNFEALWHIVDRQYCFFDYKGVNWDSIYTVYRPIVERVPTNAHLFDVMCEMLSELRDGHVNLYYAGDFGHYWAWKEDYPDNFDTELQEAYLGRDYRIAGTLRYRMLDDNIAYVACSTFSQAFGEGNLDYVFASLMGATGMILDVRDNSGGDLTCAEMLASRFTNERLLVGYSMFKAGRGHGDFSRPQPEYIEPSSYYRWQKPVVVLTNRSCYSATNTFVRDMKAIEHHRVTHRPDAQRLVTVLGDTTGGGSGMPMVSELPNGWLVRLSSSPMLDADMQHIEFGIAPHIVCSLDTAQAHHGIDSMIETARQYLSSK